MNPLSFLTETYEEMRKVVWPTSREAIRLTGMVIAVSLIVGLFIGGIDYIFTLLLQAVTK
jgi:preprotein translocase subunit SecE